MKTINRSILISALAFFVSAVSAAEVSISATAPVVDGGDVANLTSAVVTTDKWWPENNAGAGSAKGQTFKTGALKVRLRAITYQIGASNKTEPTKVYVIRVGSLVGNAFTEIHRESATQTTTWNNSEYMTWTFDTPVLLEADADYGIDVAITSSTSNWPTGIPYINVTGNDFVGGWLYTSGRNGVGEPLININTGRDRIFHIDLEYPPQGFQFILE